MDRNRYKKQPQYVMRDILQEPNSNLESFTNSLFANIKKVHRESKCCIVLGDFNINILNNDRHPPTEEFLNNFGSYFFQPRILKPTRITNYSATLIDDIFFNSLEHPTLSGNILSDGYI